MSENPYDAPRSLDLPILPGSAIGELVKSWEKKRLLYNAFFLIPGILVMAFAIRQIGIDPYWGVIIALGLGAGANVAFFAGPLAELYLRALFFGGRPMPILRRLLFFGGVFISFGAMTAFALNAWFQ